MGLAKKKLLFMAKKLRLKDSRIKFLGAAFKWKRVNFHMTFLDDLLFRIVSVFEAIALVSALCFFFLCCGCKL